MPEVKGHKIWAVGGLSNLDDLMFLKKTLHEIDDEATNQQLSIAVAF